MLPWCKEKVVRCKSLVPYNVYHSVHSQHQRDVTPLLVHIFCTPQTAVFIVGESKQEKHLTKTLERRTKYTPNLKVGKFVASGESTVERHAQVGNALNDPVMDEATRISGFNPT